MSPVTNGGRERLGQELGQLVEACPWVRLRVKRWRWRFSWRTRLYKFGPSGDVLSIPVRGNREVLRAEFYRHRWSRKPMMVGPCGERFAAPGTVEVRRPTVEVLAA